VSLRPDATAEYRSDELREQRISKKRVSTVFKSTRRLSFTG
jgi:hypothetical protein